MDLAENVAENHYLNLLSRGVLIVPSAKLAEYTSHCFAIMNYSYNIVQAHGVRDVQAAKQWLVYSANFADGTMSPPRERRFK